LPNLSKLNSNVKPEILFVRRKFYTREKHLFKITWLFHVYISGSFVLGQDSQGCARVRPGVRLRVHFVHHLGSFRQMPGKLRILIWKSQSTHPLNRDNTTVRRETVTEQFVSQIMKFIISLFNRLKSERRSTARISCSRCRRWASTITWSRSSSTCRSIGKQRKETSRAQKDSKTLEKMFYVNILWFLNKFQIKQVTPVTNKYSI